MRGRAGRLRCPGRHGTLSRTAETRPLWLRLRRGAPFSGPTGVVRTPPRDSAHGSAAYREDDIGL